MSITLPAIDYVLLSPMLVIFGAAVVSVLVEAILPSRPEQRRQLQLWLSLGATAAALGAVIAVAVLRGGSPTDRSTMSGAVMMDGPALFAQGVIALVGLASIAFMGERGLDKIGAAVQVQTSAGTRVSVASGGGNSGSGSSGSDPADAFAPSAAIVPDSPDELLAARAGYTTTEVFPLTLFALGGMLLFGACGDLLTMFIALEVLSLPLYLLCGLARRRRLLSQEASLKYFLLGAFASAIFLFGTAFAYGASGSLMLSDFRSASLSGDNRTFALIAVVFVTVGLLFKIGAVPFGSWVPDVYQGAPTPVTALMASATKVAGFAGLLRVLHVGFGDRPVVHDGAYQPLNGVTIARAYESTLVDDWRPALWAVAIATMAVATLMAVTQSDLKRLFAYSSVSHVGFLLVGAVTLTDEGVTATLFYLAAYAAAAFGGFALLAVVRDADGMEATSIEAWAGLGRRRPMVGVLMSLFLLSFAGIPLTSGFLAKFVVFAAAGSAGAWALVIVGVACSAVAAYFYVRVIVAMFFAPEPDNPPTALVPSPLTTVPIGICAGLTALLGVFPQPLLDLASSASTFLF